MSDRRTVFDVDFHPHPWVTFTDRLRFDQQERRRIGVEAVFHWKDADTTLFIDAKRELDRLAVEEVLLDRDIDNAFGRYVSLP